MRVLLVINAEVSERTARAIGAGSSPRKDYFELQRSLDADILDLGSLAQSRWSRMVKRVLGAGIAQAFLAWSLADRYDAVFADRETTGFVLAALFHLRRRRPRLTMIAHYLSPPKKQILFRALRLDRTIDCMIVHSSTQRQLARDELGLAPARIALVPYQADEQFWHPSAVPVKNQICSVGLEYRDYDTLIKAIEGLDVDVIIAAASHWSKHEAAVRDVDRVRVAAYDYAGLRDLYAESRFVVVPLQDVDNQAGITVILEAMSMGKAVVVSHTRGQMDVVRDRRTLNRAAPERVSQPNWAIQLGASEGVGASQTGFYVMPGDAGELRRAIAFLLDHPEVAEEMGANGRRVIEETMSLDLFTQRMADLITGEPEADSPSEPRLASLRAHRS